MRPITGTDILNFHTSGDDLLVLTANGEFAHIDGEGNAYDYIQTDEGEVQILLERTTITDGEFFPDALDEDGDLNPAIADEMAAIINADGILPGRVWKATEAGKAWEKAEQDTHRLAADRAAAVAEVAAFAGSQSAAARLLRLDQSTVNKLVKKANAAHHRTTATETTAEWADWAQVNDGSSRRYLDYIREAIEAGGGDPGEYDIEAVGDDYRDAIQAVLPEGVVFARGEFVGPYPAPADAVAQLRALVATIDLWEIVARHDADSPSA